MKPVASPALHSNPCQSQSRNQVSPREAPEQTSSSPAPASSSCAVSTSYPSDEHFNIPSEARIAMLEWLDCLCESRQYPRSFWACVQVCSLAKLKLFIDIAGVSHVALQHLAEEFSEIPTRWAQRSWYSPAPPPSPSDVTSSQDMSTTPDLSLINTLLRAQLAAVHRDKYQCVLTGSKEYMVVPICPLLVSSDPIKDSPRSRSIWRFFDFLWERDTIGYWYRDFFHDSDKPLEPTINSSNFICLRPDICAAFKRGSIAFCPASISEHKDGLEFEVHWLAKEVYFPLSHCPLTEVPHSTKGRDSSGDMTVILRNVPESRRLQSGQRVIVRTNDPVNEPPPSYYKFDMQWCINRVMAMSSMDHSCDQWGAYPQDDDKDNGRTAVNAHESLSFKLSVRNQGRPNMGLRDVPTRRFSKRKAEGANEWMWRVFVEEGGKKADEEDNYDPLFTWNGSNWERVCPGS